MTNLTPGGYTQQGNVLYHPHFDRPKVIQPERRGRYPKSIISLYKVRNAKSIGKWLVNQEASKAAVISPGTPQERWNSTSHWGRIEKIRDYVCVVSGLGQTEILPVISRAVEGLETLVKEKQKRASS